MTLKEMRKHISAMLKKYKIKKQKKEVKGRHKDPLKDTIKKMKEDSRNKVKKISEDE